MEEVGKRIKYYREKKGWSLREFAERVGLSHGYLGQIENNKRDPNLKILEQIANALDIEFLDLFSVRQELPIELKEIGVEWITFSSEMKEKGLSPEEIKNIISVIQSLNKNT